MSPKGFVALLLVGLCATQVAADFRYAREVEALLDSAEKKLDDVCDKNEDAARSSVESIMGFMQKIEDYALDTANDKLKELVGIDMDLKLIAKMLKENVATCLHTDSVKAKTQEIFTGVSSCVTKDVESLKGLIGNCQKIWSTAKSMPKSMKEVSKQCSEHADHDVPGDALKEFKDKSDHELAAETNAALDKAAKHLDKRALWGFGRITRCFKSVFDLAKNDLITLPGQILSTASNAYHVFKTATNGKDIPKCITEQTKEHVGAIRSLAIEVGTCLATQDLKALIAANPAFAKAMSLVENAQKLKALANIANGGAGAALGALSGLAGGAAGEAVAALGSVADLANAAGAIANVAGLAGGATGAAANLAGGAAGAAANLAGGAAGAAANLAGGAAGAAANLAGGAAGLAGGAAGAAANLAGGAAGAAAGLAGGAAGKAANLAGGAANLAGGVAGRILG